MAPVGAGWRDPPPPPKPPPPPPLRLALLTLAVAYRKDGGKVDKVDIWGRRRLAYEIAKHAEGIYAVIDLQAAPATVSELDRQLSLNESVLRTKVMRTDKH